MTISSSVNGSVGKWRRYVARKSSGVEWLGEIPSGWEMVPFKRIADIRYGLGQPPPEARDGVPLIRATNIIHGVITDTGMMLIDPAEVPPGKNATLSTGEIIVVRSGAYTGDSAIVPERFKGAIAGYDMVATIRKGVDAFFAWQLLSREVYELQFGFVKLRAAQPHLNAEELGNVVVVMPPEEEQHHIVAFLDRETNKIDSLIANKERLIELLQEKRMALISHAVTQGLDPDVPMRDSGVDWLGTLPAHWQVRKLGRFSRIGNGSTPLRDNLAYWHDGVFPWLNSAVVNEAVVGEPPRYVTKLALVECHLPVVSPGSILVAITGEGKTRGKATLLGYEATIKQHLAYIRPVVDIADSEFVRFSLESVYDVLRLLSDGAGSTKGAITCEQLRHFRIPLPGIDEQRVIVNWLKTKTSEVDALLLKVRDGIDKLREYRTALISAAVTGTIDVREEVEP